MYINRENQCVVICTVLLLARCVHLPLSRNPTITIVRYIFTIMLVRYIFNNMLVRYIFNNMLVRYIFSIMLVRYIFTITLVRYIFGLASADSDNACANGGK